MAPGAAAATICGMRARFRSIRRTVGLAAGALAVLLLGRSAVAQDLAPGVAEALRGLEAPTGAERRGAQERLTDALRATDAVALAPLLRDLAPEGLARVADAIDGAERLLPLAAELLGLGAAADEVAVLAIGHHLERFWSGLRPERVGGPELAERLAEEIAREAPAPVQLPSGLPLAGLADALALALPSVRLVVDPRLEPRLDVPGGTPAGWWQGSGDGVLLGLAESRGLELDAAVRDPRQPLEPPLVAYLRLTSRAFAETLEPRAEVIGWIAALENPSPDRARAAAQALAHCGWPGGIALLEHRVRAGDDAIALPALVTAAARGRVGSVLRELPQHQVLVAGAWASFNAGGTGQDLALRRLLGALAQIGPVGAGGVDLYAGSLFAVPLGQLADLTADERRLERFRLAVAEHAGASRPALDERLDAILGDLSAPRSLRRAALRCAAACRDFDRPAAGVPAPLELLEGLWREGRSGAELRATTLQLIRVADPAKAFEPGGALDLRDATPTPAELGALLAFAAPASLERSGRLLADALQAEPDSEAALAEGLAVRVETLDGELLDALLSRAALGLREDEVPEACFGALDRLRLRLGRLPEDEHLRQLELLGSEPGLDPRLLAALVGGESAGGDAQARLLARLTLELREPLPRPLQALAQFQEALTQAHANLLAASQDTRARRFVKDLRRRAEAAPEHPLSGWLRIEDWPPLPEAEYDTFEDLVPGLR